MFQKARSRAAALFFALTAMLVGAPAFAAGDDLSTTVVAAISGANPQIVAVIGAMAGALVLIVTWKLIRGAFGGK